MTTSKAPLAANLKGEVLRLTAQGGPGRQHRGGPARLHDEGAGSPADRGGAGPGRGGPDRLPGHHPGAGPVQDLPEVRHHLRIEGVKPDIMRVFRLFNLPKFFSILEA